MPTALDLLEYAISIALEFIALCVMTRVGRGWAWQSLGLVALVGIYALMEWVRQRMWLPFELWLVALQIVGCGVISLLVIALSRDSLGRRIFLAIVFDVYAACSAGAYNILAYTNVFALSETVAVVVANVVLLGLYAVFVLWILPQLPRDGWHIRWQYPCVAACLGLLTILANAALPLLVVPFSAWTCVPFLLEGLAIWVAFPLLCRTVRMNLRNIAVESSLELLTAEMNVRRTALDAARRHRHDSRFHRVMLGEYLLRGQYDLALAYLKKMGEAEETGDWGKLVWCEHETINAILAGASRKAAAAGVAFSAEVRVDRPLPLTDVDLVAVCANVIDNAINATKALPPVDGRAPRRGVTVAIRQRERGVGITVTNPVPPDFALSPDGLPCAEMGVGLESIRRVVDERGGVWTYEQADGVLTCQVVLMTGDR